MINAIISADPATTLLQIAKMMEQGGLGSVFIKKDGKPAGIITDRDFAIKISVNKIPLDTPVEKVASYPLQTIDYNESILVAAQKMSENNIRKLAVTVDGVVDGIITTTDMVNHLSKN